MAKDRNKPSHLSLDLDIKKLGVDKAKTLGLSFSTYVDKLIEKDCKSEVKSCLNCQCLDDTSSYCDSCYCFVKFVKKD